MDESYLQKKMEQLLKDEREKLLSEVREAILRKKALMKDNDDEKSYRKRRF